MSRDWFDGFCHPSAQRFRLPNTSDGHTQLSELVRHVPGLVKVGFETTGGQEWALWTALAAAGAGRTLPNENLSILRTLTTRRTQIVDMRQRLAVHISARKKQGVVDNIEDIDVALKAILDDQVKELERRIESTIAQDEGSAIRAQLLRSTPGIGPVSAATLIAEMPELGRMTAREAAAITGLAPVPHDSGAMRGRRTIFGVRRALRHVLLQAALAAACHNPVLKPVAKRLKERGKPHKLVIVAIARRLITIANAVLKTTSPWRTCQLA